MATTTDPIANFIVKIPDFHHRGKREKIVYIAYYLTISSKQPFTALDIERVFTDSLKLNIAGIASFLSKETKKRGGVGKFIKAKPRGYELNGKILAELKVELEKAPELKHLDDELSDYVSQVTNTEERKLLEEALGCYQISSNRATIILVWIVAMYRLQDHGFKNHLADFNSALSRHPNRNVNRIVISRLGNFTDLKELDFIEILRSAGIIDSNVRHILDTRLRTRNSAAHPSNVTFSGPQALDFSLDILKNVILKYQ